MSLGVGMGLSVVVGEYLLASGLLGPAGMSSLKGLFTMASVSEPVALASFILVRSLELRKKDLSYMFGWWKRGAQSLFCDEEK